MTRGGYSVIADYLNAEFEWPDGRDVTRQAVENWHIRRTPNQARQLPPSPVAVDHTAPRTQARFIFRVSDWTDWVRPGVPGAFNSGWVVPVPRGEGEQ
jgi:hypothetical protein